MSRTEIVIDTNVLVTGLMSNRGYSFRLLQLVGTGLFEINLSVPLLLEYEDVLQRESLKHRLPPMAVDAVLDYHCAVARHHPIHFLWRPFLRDPKDDLVLELAVKAQCSYIITYNKRDFQGAHQQFGVQVIDPREFLILLGEAK